MKVKINTGKNTKTPKNKGIKNKFKVIVMINMSMKSMKQIEKKIRILMAL